MPLNQSARSEWHTRKKRKHTERWTHGMRKMENTNTHRETNTDTFWMKVKTSKERAWAYKVKPTNKYVWAWVTINKAKLTTGQPRRIKKIVVYIWKRVTEDDVVESICTFVCWLFSLNLCHLWPPPEKKPTTATVAAQHGKQATAIH